MLSTCNCQNLASDTTGEYECDGVGMHDIEGRDDGALGLLKLALQVSRKLSGLAESLRSRATVARHMQALGADRPNFLDDTSQYKYLGGPLRYFVL